MKITKSTNLPVRMITAFMAVFFIAGCFIGLSPRSYAASSVIVKNNLNNTDIADIHFINSSGKNTFYLPGTIDITKVKVETSCTKYNCNFKDYDIVNNTIDLTPGKTTDKYGNVCYTIDLVGEGTYVFYSGSDIGAVYVSTSGGIDPLRRDRNYRDKESKLLIIDEHGNIEYDDVALDTFSEIKGRGNASFSNEKKPFQIKLGKKTDLFGMGKAKTWILLANYNDAAYIRNDCTFKIANAIELPFTPKSVFVDLYIDNQYQGIYQLCEKTQIGKNRIDITDLEEIVEALNEGITIDEHLPSFSHGADSSDSSNLDWYRGVTGIADPEDITGGYLIELDNLNSSREPSVFRTRVGNEYTVKSPEFATENEMDYIANMFSDFEQALYSDTGYNDKGKYYTEYCDLDSLVKVYVVEEITKNWDAYVGSVFFYKDADSIDSKLYAGPVWDFDNTWGNIRGRLTFETDKAELWAVGATGEWYKSDFGVALNKHPDAKKRISEIYSIAAACLEEMLVKNGYIDVLTDKLSASAAMDMVLYPVERRDQTFIYFNKYKDDTVNSAVGYLTDFMRVRTAALYSALNAKHIVHTHTLNKVNGISPTCTDDGTNEYWECSVCGNMFADANGKQIISAPVTIPATGHTLKKTDRVAPTCTETGVAEYWTCDECGKMFADANGKQIISAPVTILATGHTLKKTDRVAPTCTENGTEEYWTCENCGKMYSDSTAKNQISKPAEIKALGHAWGEWTVTKEATEEEEGVETRTCTRDPSHTETRSIPKKEVVTEITTTAETSEATTTAETVVTTLETPEITTANTNNAEPTEASTEANDKGCGSYIGFGGCAITVIVSLGSAAVIKKKKIN